MSDEENEQTKTRTIPTSEVLRMASNRTVPVSERIRIEFELREMMAGAGGMISVRTVWALVSGWLSEQKNVNIPDTNAYINHIISLAEQVARLSGDWLTDGHFDQEKFKQNFLLVDAVHPDLDTIMETLGKTIGKLDAAYGDAFRPSGAVQFCLDVAKYAKMLRDEISK